MGRQANFFINRADELSLVAAVQEKVPLEFFYTRFPEKQKRAFSVLQDLSTVYADSSLSCFNTDLTPNIILKYYANLPAYIVDNINSDVIEFSRCVTRDGRLTRGRFWFEPSGKRKEFVDWADKVFRITKKHLKKLPQGDYIGPDTLSQYKAKTLKLPDYIKVPEQGL